MRVDAILLDLMLPEMKGSPVVPRQVKQTPKVTIMTARDLSDGP